MAALAWAVKNWRIVLAIVAMLALIGGAAYFYHAGGAAQVNKQAADTLKETKEAIHDRAQADDRANRDPDNVLIDGVR